MVLLWHRDARLRLLHVRALGGQHAFVVPECPVLLSLVHHLPLHQLVEVHEVTVELGPVHAREFGFSPHVHAATPAHARSVDHDGVQADGRWDLPLSSGVRDRPHHDDRTYRYDPVDALTPVVELLERVRDETVQSFRAIVGRHEELIRGGLHLVLEDEEVL